MGRTMGLPVLVKALLWALAVRGALGFGVRSSLVLRHHGVVGDFAVVSTSSSLRAYTTTKDGTAAAKTQQLEKSKTAPFFFATVEGSAKDRVTERRRELGSQELFMLPRQYGPKLQQGVVFPQLNHVSVHVLSETPKLEDLQVAVRRLAEAHPLLRATVEGDGEPQKRIDLFQMVRSGDPSPPTFVVRDDQTDFDVDSVLRVVTVPTEKDLEASWKSAMQRDLDDSSWCRVRDEAGGGPLWKLELHRVDRNLQAPCAIVLSFNHAISDQSSANRMVDQLLAMIVDRETTGQIGDATAPKSHELPVSVEDSVLGLGQRWKDAGARGISTSTIQYVASKAAEGLKDPVILPDDAAERSATTSTPLSALTIIAGQAAGGEDDASDSRRTIVEFRTLDADTTKLLLDKCKAKGVSVSNAITAAVTLSSTDLVVGNAGDKRRNYKVLQSLDMRRFGAQLDQGETPACMAGSHDLIHGPLPDRSGEAVRKDPTKNADLFWRLAKEGKQQTDAFIRSGGPEQALRVFDFAVTISDLGNLVYLTAQSKDTKGRAYSAGATNVGVYESTLGFATQNGGRQKLKTQHGRFGVQDVYFATPHTQSGCLYPVSCLTMNDELKMTFHPVSPIVSEEANRRFADSFVGVLEAVSTGKSSTVIESSPISESSAPKALSKLPLVTAILGLAAVASHGPAWISFFQSIAEMKSNVADPADFWAALNFWIFFAVGHPLLQPILWISDVLHGTPGPKIADLVPALFLAGNAAVIAVLAASKEVRSSVNIAFVAAFFAYVGSGLEGTAGLGDFNLALDDSYKGQIVKGCPAYDEVQQPSMDNFDLKKYQGLWYEHKFHDWTQFQEVYDTTLNIKLTDDGQGWVDDFAVKGPAPDAAKLSWDKSPVANGAHYFLFGRVDKNDPPGVLRESGFGVEFPNYIVDVQKDPATGEYTEAIQFQCLERGGVRVFEGINFMSRSNVMTDEQLANMHARAEQAGMYPYGAAPEQMHTVARKLDDEPIDNSWQAMWRAIGVDKLLELLTESIEDGGR